MPIFLLNDNVVYFIHIPKTGGSSIETSLRGLGAKQALLNSSNKGFMKCTPQHMHGELIDAFIPKKFRDYSFAIFRNPVDRLISEFHMRQGRWKNGISFDGFVDYAFSTYEKNNYVFDNHIRPQVEFMTSDAKMFRFEDGLEAVLQDVTKFAGAPIPNEVPHKRKKTADRPTISNKTQKKIEQFYAADFEKFGYN